MIQYRSDYRRNGVWVKGKWTESHDPPDPIRALLRGGTQRVTCDGYTMRTKWRNR